MKNEKKNYKLLIINSKGFTLIELIVVFSVVAILSTIGISAFVNYSHIQTLQSANNDVKRIVNLAKSRSLSQVSRSCGTNRQLNGYEVRICGLPTSTCISNADFELDIKCGGIIVSPSVEVRKLPQGISFDTNRTSSSFFFPILTGGVAGNGVIVLSGFGGEKTITIDSIGNVR